MLPVQGCTGCTACASICPKHCISMGADKNGFLHPQIDSTICISCGLCEKTCPILTPKTQEEKQQPLTFSAKINNDEIREKSSSGGIFTALAEKILKDGGIVYGASFSENFAVKHIAIFKEDDLDLLRRSKYIQSRLDNCYPEIKAHLENGKRVLFSGTPCQTTGLLSFLKKPYDNLITVDFVCHGVPSPKVFEIYLNYQEKTHLSKITNINFRDKSNGWTKSCIRLDFQNGKVYKKQFGEDAYMKAFLANIILRDSCYECQNKSLHHNSDITIADYWGIEKIDACSFDEKGVSMVLVHTNNGKKLISNIKDVLTLKETDITKAIPYNPCLVKPVTPHNFRDYFLKKVGKMDFTRLVNECLSPSYVTRLHRKLLQFSDKDEK